MDSKSSLATGSVLLSIGNLLNALLGGMFWFLVARVASPQAVGQATIAVAASVLVGIFAGLSFQTAASKFIAEYNARNQPGRSRRVYSVTITVTMLSGIALAAGLIIAAPLLAVNVYGAPALTVLLIIGALSIPAQALVRSFSGVYQGSLRMDYSVIGDVAFLILRLAAVVPLVLIGYEAPSIVTAYTLGYLGSTLLSFGFLVPRILPPGTNEKFPGLSKKLFDFSTPNFISIIATTTNIQLALLLLGAFHGPDPVAFYNIAFLVRGVFAGIGVAVGLAILPAVSAKVASGHAPEVKGLYNDSVRASMMISAVPVFLMMMIPDRLLGLLSESYTQAASGLQILTVAILPFILFTIPTGVLNGLERAREVMIATVLSSACAIVATIFLVPSMGMIGAALGSLSGSVAAALIALWILATRFKLSLSPIAVLPSFLSLGAAVVVAFVSLNFLSLPASTIVGLGVFTAVGRVLGGFKFREVLTMAQFALARMGVRVG